MITLKNCYVFYPTSCSFRTRTYTQTHWIIFICKWLLVCVHLHFCYFFLYFGIQLFGAFQQVNAAAAARCVCVCVCVSPFFKQNQRSVNAQSEKEIIWFWWCARMLLCITALVFPILSCTFSRFCIFAVAAADADAAVAVVVVFLLMESNEKRWILLTYFSWSLR